MKKSFIVDEYNTKTGYETQGEEFETYEEALKRFNTYVRFEDYDYRCDVMRLYSIDENGDVELLEKVTH